MARAAAGADPDSDSIPRFVERDLRKYLSARMSNFRPVDRDTSFLLPPSVDDWLPKDHPRARP